MLKGESRSQMKLETTNSSSERDFPDSAKKATSINSPTSTNRSLPSLRQRLTYFFLFASVLVVCYCRQLFRLVEFAWTSELYSYILLIPFISAYLIWFRRPTVASKEYAPGRRYVLLSLGAGIVMLGVYRLLWGGVVTPKPEEYLPVTTLSFLLFLLAGAFAFLGTRLLRALLFPVAFLLFMVPMPPSVQHWMETFFQLGSADTAYGLLTLSGMPVFRTGTHFQLPGFPFNVAPECSGIHSSIVLIITSLLAGYIFLKSPWKRAILALVVLPLAFLRNGIRIFTIGQLCVRVGPHMIDSPIHRKGGPLFFALSLIPLFFLISYLKKREDREPIATKE
jgi:exosortase C (VPDSG-CTERM-specific)